MSAVILLGAMLFVCVYLNQHKMRMMRGEPGLPFAQDILMHIDRAFGTSFAPLPPYGEQITAENPADQSADDFRRLDEADFQKQLEAEAAENDRKNEYDWEHRRTSNEWPGMNPRHDSDTAGESSGESAGKKGKKKKKHKSKQKSKSKSKHKSKEKSKERSKHKSKNKSKVKSKSKSKSKKRKKSEETPQPYTD